MKPLRQSGQALVVLLVISVVALTLTTAASAVVIGNSQAATTTEIGQLARQLAESGVENALLRLVRDPAYTGETLTVGEGSATVEVSGTTTKTIRSVGSLAGSVRTVEVVASYNNEILTVQSWQEVF